MKKLIYVLTILLMLFIVSAWKASNQVLEEQGQENAAEAATTLKEGGGNKAGSEAAIHVDLINAKGERTGVALLTQEENGVNIDLEAWGLSKGTHGFHIHEKGACEPPTFESAGGHFNPTHKKHGFDNPKGPHAGDLPNLEVGVDGKVQESFLAEMVTLKEGEDNALIREGGTSLVIHAKPDDNISQPSGNSGDRIACGVIE